jgi:hypothetical protein
MTILACLVKDAQLFSAAVQKTKIRFVPLDLPQIFILPIHISDYIFLSFKKSGTTNKAEYSGLTKKDAAFYVFT